MGYCRSPLEGSTHVRFSRGGGVSHRKAGGKPHLKKFKPAGFGHFSPVKSVREIYSKELAKSLTFNSKPKRFISESIACTFLPQKHENTNFE